MKCSLLFSALYAAALAAPTSPLADRTAEIARDIPNYPGLQFGSDGKFSITVFSDLHFGEPSGEGKDFKTISLMNSVLDHEHPHLAVLNGDLISCEFVGPDKFEGIIDQIVTPITKRDLPFAATFGNHDYSETCSTRDMGAHMRWDVKGTHGQKLSFTTQSVDGPVEEVGCSNYFVPVYSSSDPNKLEMLLWFFDSKGGSVYQPGKNLNTPTGSYVTDPVITWFQNTRDQFNRQNGRVIPSLAFVHIPIQATRAFQKSGDRGDNTEPGINTEYIGHQDDCAGTDCYNHRDYSFMKALVETQGLMAVFSGHDHGVDWCMKWDKDLPTAPTNGNGIYFCFNRHSGFGGYSKWKRGGRQILVEEWKLGNREIETWNRLEDGEVSGRVTLNSTYGSDWYPKVERKESSGWWTEQN